MKLTNNLFVLNFEEMYSSVILNPLQLNT